MNKWYGAVGYTETKETYPGVWEEIITERKYSGDILQINRRWKSAETLNDNLTISNRFSILADPYAYQNFHAIRYIEWMESKWKVTSVEVQYPRLILDVGDLYTEQD